jgi:xanthine dehydrogenase accessory factor
MSIYEQIAEIESSGGTVAIATIIRSRGSVPRHVGSKMLIFPDGRTEGTIGGGEMESKVVGEAMQAFRDGRSRVLEYAFRDPEKGDVGVCGGEVEVFVEPLRNRPTLLVVGIGHVGRAVLHLGKWLGFRVVAADDREEFATPEMAPEADWIIDRPVQDAVGEIGINADTYVVLTTRGVDIDVACLPALLQSSARFIGVIGSRRRWETTAQTLKGQGISEEEIQRVQSPVGLDINAETPEEIALSIFAQIIQTRRGGSGETMAHAPKLIADRGGVE